jgi:hypothetical protein
MHNNVTCFVHNEGDQLYPPPIQAMTVMNGDFTLDMVAGYESIGLDEQLWLRRISGLNILISLETRIYSRLPCKWSVISDMESQSRCWLQEALNRASSSHSLNAWSQVGTTVSVSECHLVLMARVPLWACKVTSKRYICHSSGLRID